MKKQTWGDVVDAIYSQEPEAKSLSVRWWEFKQQCLWLLTKRCWIRVGWKLRYKLAPWTFGPVVMDEDSDGFGSVSYTCQKHNCDAYECECAWVDGWGWFK